MRPPLVTPAALASGLVLLLGSAPAAQAAHGYDYFVVGNPADVATPTSGLLVLQGGGTDVDENFVRMGARMGGGDFVVIRASGADGYNTYVHDLCAKTPLTYRNVEVYRVGPADTFDLESWRGAGGISYTLTAEAGVLTSSRGEVY